MSDPYDMIGRFLRNNLGDDDYAEYSAALDSLCSAQPAPVTSVEVPRLSDAEWMNIVNKNHAWFGYTPEDVAHEVFKLTEAALIAKWSKT